MNKHSFKIDLTNNQGHMLFQDKFELHTKPDIWDVVKKIRAEILPYFNRLSDMPYRIYVYIGGDREHVFTLSQAVPGSRSYQLRDEKGDFGEDTGRVGTKIDIEGPLSV